MPPKTIEIELDSRPKAHPAERIPAVDPGSEPASHGSRLLLFGILGLAVIGIAIWGVPRWFPKPAQDVVVASGRIEGREVTLAAKEIQGRVKTLLVDEGSTVNKGQLVAELESNQLDARFENLAANVSNLDAQIKQAEVDVAYTKKSTAAAIAAAEAAVSSADAHLTHGKAVVVAL